MFLFIYGSTLRKWKIDIDYCVGKYCVGKSMLHVLNERERKIQNIRKKQHGNEDVSNIFPNVLIILLVSLL